MTWKNIWNSVMSCVQSAVFFKHLRTSCSIHSFNIHSKSLRLCFRPFYLHLDLSPIPRYHGVHRRHQRRARSNGPVMVGNLNISSEKRLLFEVKLTATSYSNIELKGVEMRRRTYEVLRRTVYSSLFLV